MNASVRPEAAIIQVQELLGEGLSSRVFSALRKDSRGFSRQPVVLKILKAETGVSFLQREFEVLSKLRSPHCVRVLGWENLPEGPALVLERVEGVTLLEYAAVRPVPAEEVNEIAAQIQSGLAAVHGAGIHHGDLSPSNVMIDREGCVRLIDFALVSAPSNFITGTPPYLSPEIWSGSVSGASDDLFALGLLLDDLKSGFAEVPETSPACRERTLAAVGRSTLLAGIAGERAFLQVSSSPRARGRLGARVRKLMDARCRVRRSQTEALISGSFTASRCAARWATSGRMWRRTAAGLGILILSIPTLLGSKVSAHSSGLGMMSGARLEVRTQRWTEISLNGQKIGFSPLAVPNLAPGSHRVEWRDARGRGVIRIQMRPAAVRVITDREIDASRD